METLRVSETNSAGDESAGTVWGLRYELLGAGLGGVVVSLLIVAGILWHGHGSLLTLALAVLPAILTVSFALFRQTHPPGYDTDLIQLWRQGPGFGPKPPHNHGLS